MRRRLEFENKKKADERWRLEFENVKKVDERWRLKFEIKMYPLVPLLKLVYSDQMDLKS